MVSREVFVHDNLNNEGHETGGKEYRYGILKGKRQILFILITMLLSFDNVPQNLL